MESSGLYSTECLPITQHTINKIERAQNSIAKFSLQVPPSSANIQVWIDAELLPIKYVVCRRLLHFIRKVQQKSPTSWAHKCYLQSLERRDRYYNYFLSNLSLLSTFPHFPQDIDFAVQIAAHSYISHVMVNVPSCYE